MDDRYTKMMMDMFMAMQGQNMPGYNQGFSNSVWGDTRMFGMTPQPDSFFGPIGNMVAGFIPGMTVTGIDGNQTPVFKTNFRAQPTGMTGLQNLYMRQNAATYGATARNATMGMQGNAAKLGNGIGNILGRMGAPPGVGTALTSALGSEAGAGMAQAIANNLMGYDMGASVSVANQMSPYMASSYIRNTRMSNAIPVDVSGLNDHPLLTPDTKKDYPGYNQGTYNVMDLYNPFDKDTTDTRIAMSKMAQQASDNLVWDGIYKKDDVHGATSAYVTEIVGRALAEGTGGVNLGLPKNKELDLNAAIERQKGAQAVMDDIYNRKGDPEKGEKRGVIQLQQLISEAEKRGDKDAASLLGNELKRVMEDEVKPATDSLSDVSKEVANGMKPFVESVTGATASLKDFYGTEEESKMALDRLTGGHGFKDKDAADRLRDQITEVKLFGAMAGLSPQMTGQLFQAHEKISGRIGGSTLGRSGGTGAEAAAWTNDLLKGLIGAKIAPGQEGDYIRAHMAGHEAWNNSTGKKALTALNFAKEQGLFNDMSDSDYAELQQLMTSGSRKDLNTAMTMLGEKWTGSKAELMQMIRDPHQMAYMYGKLSQKGKDQVNRSGVLLRDNEFRKIDADSRHRVEQRQEERQLRASGISSKEIRRATGASDFDSMKEYLNGVNPDAAAILEREYRAAMEGKNPNDPDAVRQAKARAKAQFYKTGGADYLDEEQQKEMKNVMMQNRTNTLKRMNGFEGREGGTISSKEGGFFDRMGATDSHGLTRSAMEGSTKDMLSQLSKMGKSAGTRDGRDIRSAMRDFKKQRKALMKAGKYDEAEQLTQEFWNNLDDQTQQRVEMSGKRHSYATVDNMAAREKANQARQDIAVMAENAKRMGGVGTEDAYRLQELQRAAIHEADPEKKAAMLKEIKNLEDKAEKDSRSDLENAIKEAQEGNFDKLALALKNANVTAEQFYETLMKFANGGGATTTTAAEAAAAAKAGEASEGRNLFLDSTVAVSDRLGMMGSDDDVRSYIGALSGTNDVKDKHVKWYKQQMQKAAGGDKKSYLDLLKGEGEFLDYSKGNLEKQRDEAGKIAGSASVEDIKKELEGTTDEKKKAELNKKLTAAQRRDRYDVTLAKLGAQKERVDREKESVGKMSDVEFKEKMAQSAELARAGGGGASAGGLAAAGAGGSGIPELISTLQRVATLLEQNPYFKGSLME